MDRHQQGSNFANGGPEKLFGLMVVAKLTQCWRKIASKKGVLVNWGSPCQPIPGNLYCIVYTCITCIYIYYAYDDYT